MTWHTWAKCEWWKNYLKKKKNSFLSKKHDWSCFVQIHIGIQMCFEWRCSPDSVATLVVLTVAVKARCSFEVFSYVRGIFDDPYSTNVPSWDVHLHFGCAGSHKLGVTETSHATLSSLWASQIALVVVRCEFWQSRRSCAEILTRRSFIESLRRHLARAPLMEILCREFFLRSCREILPRGLLQRSCQQSSYTNFHRDLFKGSCQETSSRELVQRSCQEVSYRNLAKRALLESLCRYLWNRSCQETCYKLGTHTESLPRDLL